MNILLYQDHYPFRGHIGGVALCVTGKLFPGEIEPAHDKLLTNNPQMNYMESVVIDLEPDGAASNTIGDDRIFVDQTNRDQWGDDVRNGCLGQTGHT